jgi:hypothetical protein
LAAGEPDEPARRYYSRAASQATQWHAASSPTGHIFDRSWPLPDIEKAK